MFKLSLIILVLIFILGFLWLNIIPLIDQPSMKACTKEAKLCPDGSGVGRTGPNCEFSACPN